MVSWFLKLHKVSVTERNFRKPVSVVGPPFNSDSVKEYLVIVRVGLLVK